MLENLTDMTVRRYIGLVSYCTAMQCMNGSEMSKALYYCIDADYFLQSVDGQHKQQNSITLIINEAAKYSDTC